MNRDTFLLRLRQGLKGLPPATIDEMVADYAAHFADAERANRSDDQVSQALGDPDRLARELRAEAGLRRWETERNPNAAAGAIFAVLGLATIDILILLPILLAIGGTLFGLSVACVAVFFAGGWVTVSGLFGGPLPFAAGFAGIGIMSGSVAVGALLSAAGIVLINLLVRYGRLHYRLLKPAIEA